MSSNLEPTPLSNSTLSTTQPGTHSTPAMPALPAMPESPHPHPRPHRPHDPAPRDPTPLDVVRRVAEYLDDDRAHRTLAALLLSCKATYEQLTPMLYGHLLINGRRSDALFDLALDLGDGHGHGHGHGHDLDLDLDHDHVHDHGPDFDLDHDFAANHASHQGQGSDPESGLRGIVLRAQQDGTFFHPSSPARRLWSMSLVRTMSIRCFPDPATSLALQRTAQHLSLASFSTSRLLGGSTQGATQLSSTFNSDFAPLFPRLRQITLEPPAVDATRTFQPETYDIPHSPPFLEALTLLSRPDTLSIHFRVVPSARWESHAAATSSGAYNFVGRLNQLHISGWDSLRRLEVFGPVHHVLPSLAGVQNVYHFAPHLRQHRGGSSSATEGMEVVKGNDARGMPGPHWTYRGWQCLTAVKNVYAAASSRERARSRSRISRSVPTSRATSRAMIGRPDEGRPSSTTRSADDREGRASRKVEYAADLHEGRDRDREELPCDRDESELLRLERKKVESTTWTFVNLSGHVMTPGKSTKFVDDEEKADEEEMEGLIKGCVAVSLGRDIAGVRGDDVDGILARIQWA